MTTQIAIDEMNFAELDALREQLGLAYAKVCRRADFSPTTYARWRRWSRGEAGGSEPQSRSLQAVRDVLKAEVLRVTSVSRLFVNTRPAA